jgi:phytanoyl-CoA hydroxylase
VRYLPGSHLRGMRNHTRTKTLGFSQGIPDYPPAEDDHAEIACPARPGDMLVHHALTIHRADGNRSSQRSRRSLGFIYYSERARENAELHAAYQKRVHHGLVWVGKNAGGFFEG